MKYSRIRLRHGFWRQVSMIWGARKIRKKGNHSPRAGRRSTRWIWGCLGPRKVRRWVRNRILIQYVLGFHHRPTIADKMIRTRIPRRPSKVDSWRKMSIGWVSYCRFLARAKLIKQNWLGRSSIYSKCPNDKINNQKTKRSKIKRDLFPLLLGLRHLKITPFASQSRTQA